MKYIFLSLLLLTTALVTAQTTAKPSYTGVVAYASGGFGGYDYPVKGDSVLVYINDTQINFDVLTGHRTGKMRYTNIVFKDLKQIKKMEYKNIVSIDKQVPTGNYNMDFSYPPDYNGSSYYAVNLTHFGDGNIATLTAIDFDRENARINDMLIVNLRRLK